VSAHDFARARSWHAAQRRLHVIPKIKREKAPFIGHFNAPATLSHGTNGCCTAYARGLASKKRLYSAEKMLTEKFSLCDMYNQILFVVQKRLLMLFNVASLAGVL